jgi:hypothetical protein
VELPSALTRGLLLYCSPAQKDIQMAFMFENDTRASAFEKYLKSGSGIRKETLASLVAGSATHTI